jgi:hypothetical protein
MTSKSKGHLNPRHKRHNTPVKYHENPPSTPFDSMPSITAHFLVVKSVSFAEVPALLERLHVQASADDGQHKYVSRDYWERLYLLHAFRKRK